MEWSDARAALWCSYVRPLSVDPYAVHGWFGHLLGCETSLVMWLVSVLVEQRRRSLRCFQCMTENVLIFVMSYDVTDVNATIFSIFTDIRQNANFHDANDTWNTLPGHKFGVFINALVLIRLTINRNILPFLRSLIGCCGNNGGGMNIEVQPWYRMNHVIRQHLQQINVSF